jgi:hypothetical protein
MPDADEQPKQGNDPTMIEPTGTSSSNNKSEPVSGPTTKVKERFDDDSNNKRLKTNAQEAEEEDDQKTAESSLSEPSEEDGTFSKRATRRK